LGEFGLCPRIAPLGKLSYRLYSELASRAKAEAIGYSSLTIHTVFSSEYDPYDPSNPRLPFPVSRYVAPTHLGFVVSELSVNWAPTLEPEALSKLPSWLKVRESWKGGLINDGETAARLYV